MLWTIYGHREGVIERLTDVEADTASAALIRFKSDQERRLRETAQRLLDMEVAGLMERDARHFRPQHADIVLPTREEYTEQAIAMGGDNYLAQAKARTLYYEGRAYAVAAATSLTSMDVV